MTACMDNEVEKAFPAVWNDLLEDRCITPQEKPWGIVLGGMPGSEIGRAHV